VLSPPHPAQQQTAVELLRELPRGPAEQAGEEHADCGDLDEPELLSAEAARTDLRDGEESGK